MSQEIRIKGYFVVAYTPNISHLEVGEITHLLTTDPNFLGQ